jgi:hypothetical protein
VKQDELTHVVVAIPSGVTPAKSLLLNSFADFYLNYTKSMVKVCPLVLEEKIAPERVIDLDPGQASTPRNAVFASSLLEAFGVHRFLDVSVELLRKWVGMRAAHAGPSFGRMLVSLHFACRLLSKLSWLESLTLPVRAATAFYVFLDFSPFSPIAMFKYQDIFAKEIVPAVGVNQIGKIANMIAQIGDQQCDLFHNAEPSVITSLVKEMFAPCPIGPPVRNLSLFHAFRRNLPLAEPERLMVVRRFILSASSFSCFFASKDGFSSSLGDAPNLRKMRVQDARLAAIFARELGAFSKDFDALPAAVTANVASLDALLR